MPFNRSLAFVAAAILVAAAACRSREQGPTGGGGFPPMPVKVVEARASTIPDTTEYVATLKSLRSTTVQPQVDGQITQIRVASGQRVAQGAPLMQIDARRQQAA